MTIDEAIRVNQELLDGEYDHRDATMENALQLGIEALKDIAHCRTLGILDAEHYLPGETKE